MKKILLFYLFLLLLLPFLAFASPVQIGNLFYELSSTDKTAEVTSPAFEEDVYDAISLKTCVEGRRLIGGPAPDTVKKYLDEQ